MTDTTQTSERISGMTLSEWQVFARKDYCLDKMVPSDLRQLIQKLIEAKHKADPDMTNTTQAPGCEYCVDGLQADGETPCSCQVKPEMAAIVKPGYTVDESYRPDGSPCTLDEAITLRSAAELRNEVLEEIASALPALGPTTGPDGPTAIDTVIFDTLELCAERILALKSSAPKTSDESRPQALADLAAYDAKEGLI